MADKNGVEKRIRTEEGAWQWIGRNADWLCARTFGHFSPGVRFALGIAYELFDYILRFATLLLPVDFVLDGPYLVVSILLAGQEGFLWGFSNALIGIIPIVGDWFPGVSVATYRIWSGSAPDPSGYRERGLQPSVSMGGEKNMRRGGCLPVLAALLTFFVLYFGIQWMLASFYYDYRDLAWESVKNSQAGLTARGRDEIERRTSGLVEAVKPWWEKGKSAAGKVIGDLQDRFGIGEEGSEDLADLEDKAAQQEAARKAAEAEERRKKEEATKKVPAAPKNSFLGQVKEWAKTHTPPTKTLVWWAVAVLMGSIIFRSVSSRIGKAIALLIIIVFSVRVGWQMFAPPPTPQQQAAALEALNKQKLLERAAEKGLGPHASELYAGEQTTKKAEELRERDRVYYAWWFWRTAGLDVVIWIILAVFWTGGNNTTVFSRRQRQDYLDLDE